MKICLINFHYAYNYGALLQCLALKCILEKLGHDVSVINYRPAYQQQYYLEYPNPFESAVWAYRKFKHQCFKKRIYHAVGRFVRVLILYKEANSRRNLGKSIKPFVENQLNLTCEFKTYKALRENPPKCDAYICGSDQLWNPDVTWGLDPAYFLNFGSSHIKRIAYAVSPCGLNIKEYYQELKEYSKIMDSISLREFDKKNELERLLKRNIEICPDPTLLLNIDDYTRYEEEISEKLNSYILVYAFDDGVNNKCLFDLALKARDYYGQEIVDISLEHLNWPYSIRKEFGVSPGKFLTYFKKASFIVTNSFHGTAFSIIYHKQFFAMPKSSTGARIRELLEKLDLENRLFEPGNVGNVIFELKINYAKTNLNRNKIKQSGISYLERQL